MLAAILFGIIGVSMLARLLITAEALTFLMSVFLLIAGVYQLVASMCMHLVGWGWHALNGVIASVLGILLLVQWPVSGLYAIGLFIGIDLIFYGLAWVALALNLHKM